MSDRNISNQSTIVLQQNFILLSHLTKLDLSKNQIEELPENFGELAKLKHLDLYRNNLNHLPLSFSKLKSLKWLDLKDNPLVPRIAEAAGPCLDNKQCQECARNIVLFYTQLQQQVEKEREIREKHRQQNLLINNTTAKKQTQEKKSKKKNNKKEKLENNNCSSKIASDTIKADQNSVIQSDSSNNTKAHGKSYLFVFYVLLLVVVFIIVLFICTSLDVSQTKNIDKYVRNVWNTGIDKLPEKLRYLAIQTGKHISDIHTFTGTQISRLIEVYIKK